MDDSTRIGLQRAFGRVPAVFLLLAALALAGCAAGGGSLARDPALTDDRLAQIRYGMSRDEIRRLVGAPDETMTFPLSGTEAWDYLYQDTWGYLASFSVTFDAEGRVVGRISRRLNAGGDRGM
jgi:outer membrane protein assembly factor BamE (lipoprotein component of BamABCDE complex)